MQSHEDAFVCLIFTQTFRCRIPCDQIPVITLSSIGFLSNILIINAFSALCQSISMHFKNCVGHSLKEDEEKTIVGLELRTSIVFFLLLFLFLSFAFQNIRHILFLIITHNFLWYNYVQACILFYCFCRLKALLRTYLQSILQTKHSPNCIQVCDHF